jgi:FdhD protein
MWTRRIKIVRLTGPVRKKKEDQLIFDREFILNLNGEETSFICVPSNIKEMMIGYAFHKGHIDSANDIKEITTKDNVIHMTTEPSTKKKKPIEIDENYMIAAEKLYSKMYDFQDSAALFKESAITHSASFADEKDLHHFSEDIERIHACYKAIGGALTSKKSIQNKWFLCSSKIDKPLVVSLIRLGVRHIVSRIAPTNEAYVLAKDSGCTLIGFCRSQKCNLYCGTIN